MIASPFKGLQLSEVLVCEFFAAFSRFEYTLKEAGFVRPNQQYAEVAWWTFAEKASEFLHVEPESKLAQALLDLTLEPPQVQISKSQWMQVQLHGNSQIEKAIDAVTRVRNNLFHGGKHTPHSPSGRDEKLVRASLAVLYACLEQNSILRNTYEQNVF